MNADERRFTETGNTDDADLADFRRYEIRVYPRHPCNPHSIGGTTYLIILTKQIPGAVTVPKATLNFTNFQYVNGFV